MLNDNPSVPPPTKRAKRAPTNDKEIHEGVVNGVTSSASSSKGLTKNEKILTFTMSHSPIQVLALSSNTIFDLIQCICQETTIGQNESVHCHLWDVHIPGKGKYAYECMPDCYDFDDKRESSAREAKLGDLDLQPDTTMIFNYDYGACFKYTLKFVDCTAEQALSENDQKQFPKRKEESGPVSYTKFVPSNPNIDVNTMFPSLNKWLFAEGRFTVDLNFFQAGRKTKQHGYLEKDTRGIMQMIYLPTKVGGGDLSNYLHCLDHATAASNPSGYNWYSLVVLSKSDVTERLLSHYNDTQVGFCEKTISPDAPSNLSALNDIFPKVAALAGYKKKKDDKVPKGWISYKNKMLMICSGAPKPYKSNAPRGTAYDGTGQHTPNTSGDILLQKNVEIESLHDFFCVVEGLLETL